VGKLRSRPAFTKEATSTQYINIGTVNTLTDSIAIVDLVIKKDVQAFIKTDAMGTKQIKQRKELASTPAIIYSTSSQP
jgi:hypothetical protein